MNWLHCRTVITDDMAMCLFVFVFVLCSCLLFLSVNLGGTFENKKMDILSAVSI